MHRARLLLPVLAAAALASCAVPFRPTVPALVDRDGPPADPAVVNQPSIAAGGGTLVAIGSVDGGRDVAIGRSTDGGATWTQQPAAEQPGFRHEPRVADAVAYDASHGVWLAVTTDNITALDGSGMLNATTVLHRSTDDGRTWSIATNHAGTASIAYAEAALACDGTTTSTFYGRCYWADRVAARFGRRGNLWTSDAGGATWQQSPALLPSDPVSMAVAPDGDLVLAHTADGSITVSSTSDGGTTFTTTAVATTARSGAVAPRSGGRIAALADSTFVLAWPDCRFQPGCTRNDLVVARSTAAGGLSAPVAVPVGEVGEALDVAVGAVAADAGGIHVAVQAVVNGAACPDATCRLSTRLASSTDGGATWTRSVLGEDRPVGALPTNDSGQATVGGRIGLALLAGRPVPAFVVANPTLAGPRDVAVHVPRP